MSTYDTTYGHDRDRLAHALTELLAAPEPQLGPTEATQVLQYRDLLLRNLTSITDEVLGASAGADRSLAAAATSPARALRGTLHRLPAASGEQVPPSEVLASTPPTRYAATWRTAATTSLLAADALAAGEPRTWRTHADTSWAVIADTSAAAHALAALDRRLATHPSGHLTDQARDAVRASWRTGLPLVTSEVSRLAHSQPLAPDADGVGRPPALCPFPVTDAVQLVPGYRHVLRLLDARGGILPLRTLGHLLVAQARISHTLADRCQQAHAAGAIEAAHLADQWRDHAHAAESLAAHRRAVTGLHPGIRHPALAQAGEVLRGLEHLTVHNNARGAHADLDQKVKPMHAAAMKIEHTIAAGIERSFARDLYLVPNESTRGRSAALSWVPSRCTTDEHLMLTTARSIREATVPAATPPPGVSSTSAQGVARDRLQQALYAHGPARTGHPAMTQT